jgi:hypothetical protein
MTAAAPKLPSFALLLARYGRNSAAFVREVLGLEPDVWQLAGPIQ